MSGEIECPYCEANCGVPDEPSDEGVLMEWECDECGKNFVYHAEYSVDHYSEKAPCLNAGEHLWEPMIGAPKEFFKGKFRCKYCGKEKIELNEQ